MQVINLRSIDLCNGGHYLNYIKTSANLIDSLRESVRPWVFNSAAGSCTTV